MRCDSEAGIRGSGLAVDKAHWARIPPPRCRRRQCYTCRRLLCCTSRKRRSRNYRRPSLRNSCRRTVHKRPLPDRQRQRHSARQAPAAASTNRKSARRSNPMMAIDHKRGRRRPVKAAAISSSTSVSLHVREFSFGGGHAMLTNRNKTAPQVKPRLRFFNRKARMSRNCHTPPRTATVMASADSRQAGKKRSRAQIRTIVGHDRALTLPLLVQIV